LPGRKTPTLLLRVIASTFPEYPVLAISCHIFSGVSGTFHSHFKRQPLYPPLVYPLVI
jgi:hypothetical protein